MATTRRNAQIVRFTGRIPLLFSFPVFVVESRPNNLLLSLLPFSLFFYRDSMFPVDDGNLNISLTKVSTTEETINIWYSGACLCQPTLSASLSAIYLMCYILLLIRLLRKVIEYGSIS